MTSKYSGLCIVLLLYHSSASAVSFKAFENSSNDTPEKCILTIAKTNFPKGSLIAIAKPQQWHSTLIHPIYKMDTDTNVANGLMTEIKWNFLTRTSRNMSSDNDLVSSN